MRTMATIIDMPKLSDTMSVGTLVTWLKQVGESVEVGEAVAEIETDKATMELEAFDDGVILAQYVAEGDEVAIGEPILAIGKDGEAAPDKPAGKATPSKPAATKEEPGPISKPIADPAGQTKAASSAAPGPEAFGAATPDQPPSSKPKPTPMPTALTPSTKAAQTVAQLSTAQSGERIKASPLARRIAEGKGVDLSAIQGTGPGGRIVKADVLLAAEETAREPAPDAATRDTSSSAQTPVFVAPQGAAIAEEADLKVSNMRATIARRLVESKTQLPHFYLNMEVDAAPLLQLRKELNASLAELPPEKGGIKLSVNDLILKASAEALRRVPAVNRSWMGDTIRQHGAVHLAFGVAIDDGLLTPVIRDAHAKGVRQIASEAKELITKARNKKLKPDEMMGSTFTVTNLGMFGINEFFGIINPPNAAILSVGATEEKPVVKNGQIVPGLRMNIGLSGDHRVIDGASGANFLMALRELIEKPALMLL